MKNTQEYSSTSWLGMEQVQNGRLYIRYRSSSQRNEAEEPKNVYGLYPFRYSNAKSTPLVLLIFLHLDYHPTTIARSTIGLTLWRGASSTDLTYWLVAMQNSFFSTNCAHRLQTCRVFERRWLIPCVSVRSISLASCDSKTIFATKIWLFFAVVCQYWPPSTLYLL